jgi:hypothetical protein
MAAVTYPNIKIERMGPSCLAAYELSADGNLPNQGGTHPVMHRSITCGGLLRQSAGRDSYLSIEVFVASDGTFWSRYHLPGGVEQPNTAHVRRDAASPFRFWREVRLCTFCGDGLFSGVLSQGREWQAEGACYDSADPGFFEGGPRYKELTEGQIRALRMCASCVVRPRCREYGRAMHRLEAGGIPGIFGGETEVQRRELYG